MVKCRKIGGVAVKRIIAVLLLAACLCGCAAVRGADVAEFVPEEEQRLVVYTTLDESVYGSLITEFQNRTGVWVQVQTGSARELTAAAEENPEQWDVLLVSGIDSLQGRESMFRPNEADEPWTAVTMSPLVLIYNPKLVRLQIPTGWKSLMDSVWKGEIAFADPETDVSGQSALGLMHFFWGDDGLEAFSQGVSGLLTDQSSVAARVADGSYCLGVVTEDVALTAIAAGYSLTLLYPEEGTCPVPDCAGISGQAPHPENAEKFMEFLLSGDVQSYAVTHCYRRGINETLAELPGTVYGYNALHSRWVSCSELWKRLREVAS